MASLENDFVDANWLEKTQIPKACWKVHFCESVVAQ